jgi:hypothetical protein
MDTRHLENPDVVNSDASEEVGERVGRAAHFCLGKAVGGNARDPGEVNEDSLELVELGVDPTEGLLEVGAGGLHLVRPLEDEPPTDPRRQDVQRVR